MQIAVGGCLAQKDQGLIVEKAPYVDVVFGTHNVGSLPVLLERARVEQQSQVELLEALEVFPSTLPARRESSYSGVGQHQRRLRQHLHLLHRPEPARQGAGPHPRRHPARGRGAGGAGRRRGHAARPERQLLRPLLRRQGRVRQAAAASRHHRHRADPVHQPAPARLHRRRDRRDGRDTAPSARACTCRCSPAPTTCCAGCAAPTGPSASSASSSGSARRSPTRLSPPTSSSASLARPRPTSRPPSTSCGPSRFAGAFTFQYSPRPGTPAADYPDQVDPETVADRYQRLVAVQELIGYEGMQEQVGKTVEVLLSKGEGRKDGPDQMTGRARDNRLVHLPRHPERRPGRCRRDGHHRRRPALPQGRPRSSAFAVPGLSKPQASRWGCRRSGRPPEPRHRGRRTDRDRQVRPRRRARPGARRRDRQRRLHAALQGHGHRYGEAAAL